MDRRKGKGKMENKVGTRSAGGVPTWADIARASTSLYKRGRWLHQTEGTPAGRKGQEEAARALATRFFFDGRMKGKRGAHFFLSYFLFVSFVWASNGEKEKRESPKGSITTTGTGFGFLLSRVGLLGLRSMYIK
jgi:hypothetical protein